MTLEPNLNLILCYQRYLGERTPEYDASGWTFESLDPESLQNGEPIFSTENTLRTSIGEINVTCNLKKLEKYGRANFGVQQLPLFNLLRPEDADWLTCLS